MDDNKELRENIKVLMMKVDEAKDELQKEIEKLYILEKGEQGLIDIGWKRKGRELGFVLWVL